jgi:ketosteroid isomerase-like protein
MKNIHLLLPLLLLAACQGATPATPSAKTDTATTPAASASAATQPPPADTSGLIIVLQNSAVAWNKGDLAGFMDSYDDSATMMSRHGLIGKDSMTFHYRQTYFQAGAARQQLTFDQYHITPLAGDYVLLTGRFTLNGNNLPTLSGWFSLVCVHRKTGWKVLHDHTS